VCACVARELRRRRRRKNPNAKRPAAATTHPTPIPAPTPDDIPEDFLDSLGLGDVLGEDEGELLGEDEGELLGEETEGVDEGVELGRLAELVILSDAFQNTADVESIFCSWLASFTSPVFGLT
jgi:hypothetical protein